MLIETKNILEEQVINRCLPVNISEDDKKYFKTALSSKAKATEIKTFRNVSINNELFMKSSVKCR